MSLANAHAEAQSKTSTSPRRRRRTQTELIRRRILAGLSPNQLADEIGVAGNSIRDYEAGATIPGPRIQAMIAKRLSTDEQIVTPLDLWPLADQVKHLSTAPRVRR